MIVVVTEVIQIIGKDFPAIWISAFPEFPALQSSIMSPFAQYYMLSQYHKEPPISNTTPNSTLLSCFRNP